MDRDIELAELGLQNQATWRVFDFAVRLREGSTRLHGVAFGLLPFAAAAVGASALLFYAALGALFLSIVGVNSFTNINGLRMLQYRLAVEEGRSRVSLRGGVAVHGNEVDAPHPPQLSEQMDPMGTVTRSARWVAAADIGVLGPLLLTGLIVRYGAGRELLTVTLVAAAAITSAAPVALWLGWSRQHAERAEQSLAKELSRHLPTGG